MFLIVRNLKSFDFNITSVHDAAMASEILKDSNIDGESYSAFTIESSEELHEFGFSMDELIALHAQGAGKAPKKFKTKSEGAKRVFPFLDQLAVRANDFVAPGKKPKGTPKASGPRKSKGVDIAPKDTVVAVREGTKQHLLLAALDDGATMAELEAVLPNWTTATIKSALYHDVNNLKGYGISTQVINDVPVYTLEFPKGVEAILITPKKEK